MDQSKPIEIRMDFNLLRIRNFDDISGELGLTGYFKNVNTPRQYFHVHCTDQSFAQRSTLS
jgi:hypothetical protein